MRLRCFVINLDRRPDRLATFEKRAAEAGINYERQSGVDGKLLTADTPDVHLFINVAERPLKNSEKGVALTFFRLWKQLLQDQSADAYLLLEDDVEFLPGFRQKLDHVISDADAHHPQWNLIWLSSICNAYKQGRPTADKDMLPSAQPTGWDYFGGMWCFVVSKHGARFLVDRMQAGACNRAIDAWIAHLGPHVFPTLTCRPMIAWANIFENGADTDIQNEASDQKAHDRRIVCRLRGGVEPGEQLFRMAASFLVSEEAGLDRPLFDEPSDDLKERKQTLANLGHWHSSLCPSDAPLTATVAKVPWDAATVAAVKAAKGWVELTGTFRRATYFDDANERRRKLLKWYFAPSSSFKSAVDRRIQTTLTSFGLDRGPSQVCAMHVQAAIPLNYYEEAMRIVRLRHPLMHVLVFTDHADDARHARAHLQDRCFIVDEVSQMGTARWAAMLEQLLFMAACGAQIISGSGASWWAAYLSESDTVSRRTVVAPLLNADESWVSPGFGWTALDCKQQQSHPTTLLRSLTPTHVRLLEGGHYFRPFFEHLMPELRCSLAAPKADAGEAVIFSVFGDRHKIHTRGKQPNEPNEPNEPKAPKGREVFLCGEPRTAEVADAVDADLRLHCCRTPGSVYLPFWVTCFFERKQHTLSEFRGTAVQPKSAPHPSAKTRFCAFMYSNEVPERNLFFDMLSKYKRVDGLGRCRRNTDSPLDRHESGDQSRASFYDLAVQRYEPYKFVIAFENCHMPGYITEKLVNPMLCRSPPIIIYYGAPDVGTYFNTQAFINVADFPDFERAIDFIVQVDTNPDLYAKILRQPYILPNQLPHSDLTRYAAVVRSCFWSQTVAEPTMRRVAAFRQWRSERCTAVTAIKIGQRDARLLSQWRGPLVVFCDPADYLSVWSTRRSAGGNLLHNTFFLSGPPDGTERCERYERYDTAAKKRMIQRAIRLDPFQSPYVAWSDSDTDGPGPEHLCQSSNVNLNLAIVAAPKSHMLAACL